MRLYCIIDISIFVLIYQLLRNILLIMETDNLLFFHHLDICIKSYRQYQQNMLDLAKIDITPDQYGVLELLGRNKGYSQRDIAKKLGKDAASVHRILALLEKKGYISHLREAGQSQNRKLQPTETGRNILEAAGAALSSAAEEAIKGIKPKRLTKLEKTLRDITRNLKK